jgi:hypothetical protein
VGVAQGYAAQNDTGWIFSTLRKDAGIVPYCERLNPVVGGYTIIHDWLVPRGDWGQSEWNDGVSDGSIAWTNTALRYFVAEPSIGYRNQNFVNHTGGSVGSTFWTLEDLSATRNRLKDYAVFVVDDEIYVRTAFFVGTGRFFPSILILDEADQSRTPASGYILLNMADYNIWRKNYPDFDWNKSCIGKIGETVVLFETDEADMNPLDQGIMRVSRNRRYIPLINKVDWRDDADGTNTALIPQIRTLTAPEEAELQISLSAARGGMQNRAYGFDKENDIFKTFYLDAAGVESPSSDDLPCYKGANGHFMPGGNPISGAFGPYIVSNDNKHAFVSDIRASLSQRMMEAAVRPVALETSEIDDVDENDAPTGTRTITERLSIMDAKPGRIGVNEGTTIKTSAPSRGISVEEEWEKYLLDPFTFRLLRSVEGSEVYATADGKSLPVWNYPILWAIRNDPTVNHFSFAWINPDTGEITPHTEQKTVLYNGAYGNTLAVKYDPANGIIQFGEYDSQSSQITNPFSIPSYLDGWVGMTDMFFLGDMNNTFTNNSNPLRKDFISVNIGSSSGMMTAIDYAPTLEIVESLGITPMHYNYNEARNGSVSSIYSGKPVAIDELCIGFPSYDLSLPIKARFKNDNILSNMMMDGYFFDSSGRVIMGTPRTHHIDRTFWGIDDLYLCSVVCFAHYGKGPFEVTTTYLEVQGSTADPASYKYDRPIPVHRYEHELFVIKCRNGYSDKAGGTSDNPWTNDRFIVIRMDVDIGKYNALTSAAGRLVSRSWL